MNYELFNGMMKVSVDITNNNVVDNKCENDNHVYSDWFEKECFSNYNGSTFRNKIWCRKCMKCGNVDFTFVKPMNYVNSDKKILKREK